MAEQCEQCWSRNQVARHIHFLQLPREGLVGHLRGEFGEKADATGLIDAIVEWVRAIRDRYGELSGEHGQRLPLWQAWQEALKCGYRPQDVVVQDINIHVDYPSTQKD